MLINIPNLIGFEIERIFKHESSIWSYSDSIWAPSLNPLLIQETIDKKKTQSVFERVFTELESNKSHLTLDQKEMLTMLAMRHSRLVKHQIKGIVDKLYLEENKLAYDLLRFIQVIKKR
ncbi:MAG: hypothetical protein H6574_21615 [Lewinellaceae bacterium]|nr:hypothetical protein [Lewinellaceae bacterium]